MSVEGIDKLNLEVSPSRLTQIMEHSYDVNRNLMIWGPPGGGKSALARQLADRRKCIFIDVRALLLDPVDLRGLPYVKDGRAFWAAPSFLPVHDLDTILFLDELPQSPQSVQAALLQLVWDRAIGEYRLPPRVRIWAAGNRLGDRAGGHRMISPMGPRFTHVELAVSNDDWHEWARTAGIDPIVRGYLKYRPESLMRFDPRADAHTFACPRSWEILSSYVPGLRDETALTITAGTVGTADAPAFVEFMHTFRTLPDMDLLLADPKRATIPDRPDILWATCMALSDKAKSFGRDLKKMGPIGTFACRLADESRKEFCIMLTKDCMAVTGGQFTIVPEARPIFDKYANLILGREAA